MSLCLCPALFSEVLRRTATKLGEGSGLGRGRPSLNASATRCREGFFQGQILIDSRMEVKLGGWNRHQMPKMLKVRLGVIQGQMGSNPYRYIMSLFYILFEEKTPIVTYGIETWWVEIVRGQKLWRSVQGHQGSSRVKWLTIVLRK